MAHVSLDRAGVLHCSPAPVLVMLPCSARACVLHGVGNHWPTLGSRTGPGTCLAPSDNRPHAS
eukprot:4566862-Heterocapsa_arctica.AAC.1